MAGAARIGSSSFWTRRISIEVQKAWRWHVDSSLEAAACRRRTYRSIPVLSNQCDPVVWRGRGRQEGRSRVRPGTLRRVILAVRRHLRFVASTGARSPRRYHTFLRALEGAFLVHREGQDAVVLNRKGKLPDGTESVPLEIALCRECGEHYYVGRERHGRLEEAVRGPKPAGLRGRVLSSVGVECWCNARAVPSLRRSVRLSARKVQLQLWRLGRAPR